MADIRLIIADKPLAAAILEQLNMAGLGDVKESGDFVAALGSDSVSAIILDESSADKKNLKALREAEGPKKKPVFLLGAIAAEAGEGANAEFFTKPLRLGHLIARLQFHILSAPKLRGVPFIFGPYRYDPQNRCVMAEDRSDSIRLTEKEAALLEYLGNSAAPVGREELLAAIWGYDGRIDTHTLETHIYQLRHKLDPEGKGVEVLLTEQGAYRLKRG
jgi:DNA-binding response OmpR family regulator